MVRAMTQAERVLDGIREPEKDGTSVSQSVQRRALAKEIFGESPYHLDAILCRNTINPGRYVILEDQEVKSVVRL